MTDSTAPTALCEIANEADVILLDLPVTISFEPVADELNRRRGAGLGPIVDRELLSILFELPVDMEVPRSVLSQRAQRLLRKGPSGAAELTRQSVIRRAVPAVRVRHVTTHGRATVSLLRALSVFGPFCTRSLLVSGRDPGPDVLDEAVRLGIGLASPGTGWLVPPAPHVVRRHTAASWLLAERALAVLWLGNALTQE